MHYTVTLSYWLLAAWCLTSACWGAVATLWVLRFLEGRR